MEKQSKTIGFIIPVIAGVFNILIILFPSDMISAARDGLWLWFNNVVPSLLPFVILTNILAESGALSSLSVLLEPLMRPLFGVPGAGGFALTAGMVSGYPVGAKITAQLRTDGLLTRTEAQRLLAFCNNSGPLFMLGAVGVSMFNSAAIGYFIMATHYISAFITGLLFRYYGSDADTRTHIPARARKPTDARVSIGRILSGSVKNAAETLALVGGFIILFCVVVKVLEVTQVTAFAGALLSTVFPISGSTAAGLLTGLMEITGGARTLSADVFSRQQIITLCGVVAFGGFCIHAQTLSFISHTDIKASVYILAKAVQAFIAAATASLLFPFVTLNAEASVPAFLATSLPESAFWQKLAFSTVSFFGVSGLIVAVSVVGVWRKASHRR